MRVSYDSQGIIFGSVYGADGVGRIVDIKGSSKHRLGDRVVVMPSVGWVKDPRGPEDAYYILGGGQVQGNVPSLSLFFWWRNLFSGCSFTNMQIDYPLPRHLF